eukprot:gene42970-57142_t
MNDRDRDVHKDDMSLIDMDAIKILLKGNTNTNTGNVNGNVNGSEHEDRDVSDRTQVDASLVKDRDESSEAFAMLSAEQQRGLGESEESMAGRDEVALPGATYWWQDKYRPRKPRYFNRVRTGFDWNKYNSTHYDHDNPPPKTIQGYKFNVFYPDLIDKTKTPQYFVEASDDPDFLILRFHAGPPYEDIAFKIVNREWDVGRKTGFKCIFERGVLQFHFNFKRHRYRR